MTNKIREIPGNVSALLYGIWSFFFSKDNHWFKKVIWVSSILVIIFLVNDILKISFNYNVNSKIQQISNIEDIKWKFSQQYFIEQSLIEELDKIEKEILEKEPFLLKKISSIKIWEASDTFLWGVKNLFNIRKYNIEVIDIFYYLSIHWIWIIIFIAWFSDLVDKSKSKETRMFNWYGLPIILLIMFIWHMFFTFMYRWFWIDTLWWAIIFNIVIYSALFFSALVNNLGTQKLKK